MAEPELRLQMDLSTLVDGPFVVTFTAHLPFPVSIPNELGHIISFNAPFKDQEARAHFGNQPFVRIRVFDSTESRLFSFMQGFERVIQNFYGVQLPTYQQEAREDERLAEHDQWISLETPYALAEGENAADRAFAFHRCLYAFNLFLRAALVITKAIRIRPISSQDLRPVVLVGALPHGQRRRALMPLLMHPEALGERLLTDGRPFNEDDLRSALAALSTNQPYLTTLLWRSRAQRALIHSGDAADAIISFQIAAESMLFDTYRMLLIDEGRSSVEVASELTDLPFKSLVTSRLPKKLGGQWDVCPWPWQCIHGWPRRSPIVARGVPTGGQGSPPPPDLD